MASKNSWKEYFVFSKKERNAVIILLVLMLLLLVAPFFFKATEKEIPVIDLSLQKQLDSVLDKNNSTYEKDYKQDSYENKNSVNYSANENNVKLNPFNFDPNTLSEEGFQKIGLPQRNINTIIHYRDKGGKFRRPEDIKKIYGLKEEISNQLIPFIKIAGDNNRETFTNYPKENGYNNDKPAAPKEKLHVLNINTATEEEWKSLPGIGDVLSKRIVKFRNSIGGFKSIDDVARTYGLADSTFQKLKPFLKME